MSLASDIAAEFQDKDYRHAYVDDFLDASIAAQIKAIRESRGLTQEKLAQLAGMKQSRISVLEDVNYDSWSINTLRKLARAFDVALVVKFESFAKRVAEITQFSKESLLVPAFTCPDQATAAALMQAQDRAATEAAQDHIATLKQQKQSIIEDFERQEKTTQDALRDQESAIEQAAKAEVDAINAALSAALMDNAAAQRNISSLSIPAAKSLAALLTNHIKKRENDSGAVATLEDDEE